MIFDFRLKRKNSIYGHDARRETRLTFNGDLETLCTGYRIRMTVIYLPPPLQLLIIISMNFNSPHQPRGLACQPEAKRRLVGRQGPTTLQASSR